MPWSAGAVQHDHTSEPPICALASLLDGRSLNHGAVVSEHFCVACLKNLNRQTGMIESDRREATSRATFSLFLTAVFC